MSVFLWADVCFLGPRKEVSGIFYKSRGYRSNRPLIGGASLMGVAKGLTNGQRKAVGSYFAGVFFSGTKACWPLADQLVGEDSTGRQGPL